MTVCSFAMKEATEDLNETLCSHARNFIFKSEEVSDGASVVLLMQNHVQGESSVGWLQIKLWNYSRFLLHISELTDIRKVLINIETLDSLKNSLSSLSFANLTYKLF